MLLRRPNAKILPKTENCSRIALDDWEGEETRAELSNSQPASAMSEEFLMPVVCSHSSCSFRSILSWHVNWSQWFVTACLMDTKETDWKQAMHPCSASVQQWQTTNEGVEIQFVLRPKMQHLQPSLIHQMILTTQCGIVSSPNWHHENQWKKICNDHFWYPFRFNLQWIVRAKPPLKRW